MLAKLRPDLSDEKLSIPALRIGDDVKIQLDLSNKAFPAVQPEFKLHPIFFYNTIIFVDEIFYLVNSIDLEGISS